MTNKEKRKYMSDILLYNEPSFLSEMKNKNDFINKTPLTLYKYRKFDQYTFEMIEQNYSYLSPVKDLDDPFDCLNDFSFSDTYNESKKTITTKGIEFVINQVCAEGFNGISKKELIEIVRGCTKEDGLDYEKTRQTALELKLCTSEQADILINLLEYFNLNFESVLLSTKMTDFAKKAKKPGEIVGVCSLTEKKDNRVMWNQYGDEYNGYCIEYEIPKKKEVFLNLCPVIYTKAANNNFINKMIEYYLASAKRALSEGRVSGNIGSAMELFCTKHTDWSYQSEWRLIGEAKDRFKHLKIKSIYLGFRVDKSKQKTMLEYAHKYHFNLYLMNNPDGTKKIKYATLHSKHD